MASKRPHFPFQGQSIDNMRSHSIYRFANLAEAKDIRRLGSWKAKRRKENSRKARAIDKSISSGQTQKLTLFHGCQFANEIHSSATDKKNGNSALHFVAFCCPTGVPWLESTVDTHRWHWMAKGCQSVSTHNDVPIQKTRNIKNIYNYYKKKIIII